MQFQKNTYLDSLNVVSASERKLWSTTKPSWAWMLMIQLKMSLLIDEIASYSAATTEHEHSGPPSPCLGSRGRKKDPPCTSTTAVFGASIITDCWFGHKMFPFIRQQCSQSFSLQPVVTPSAAHLSAWPPRWQPEISQAAAAHSSGGEPSASQDARNKGDPQVEAGFHCFNDPGSP